MHSGKESGLFRRVRVGSGQRAARRELDGRAQPQTLDDFFAVLFMWNAIILLQSGLA